VGRSLSRLPNSLGCGSFSDCGPTEHRGEVVAHEGIAQLKVALPVLADRSVSRKEGTRMGRVIVGVDPHKKSVTIEVVDDQGRVLATVRFGTDNRGYHAMVGYVRRQWRHHCAWRGPGARLLPYVACKRVCSRQPSSGLGWRRAGLPMVTRGLGSRHICGLAPSVALVRGSSGRRGLHRAQGEAAGDGGIPGGAGGEDGVKLT
jgi:hypothetical protein